MGWMLDRVLSWMGNLGINESLALRMQRKKIRREKLMFFDMKLKGEPTRQRIVLSLQII
jgi:hypothetical protein